MTFCPNMFIYEANSAYYYSDNKQRYGQFLINYLNQRFPNIEVPDSANCFYDNKKVEEFLEFIYNYQTQNNSHA